MGCSTQCFKRLTREWLHLSYCQRTSLTEIAGLKASQYQQLIIRHQTENQVLKAIPFQLESYYQFLRLGPYEIDKEDEN